MRGDTSAISPGGVRVGTAALTSRSFKEEDFDKVAEFLHKAVQVALVVQEKAGSKLIKDFLVALEGNVELAHLKKAVEEFSMQFPMPGFEASHLRPKKTD